MWPTWEQGKRIFERRFLEQQGKNTWSCPLHPTTEICTCFIENRKRPQALALLGEAPSRTIGLLTGKYHEPPPELGVFCEFHDDVALRFWVVRQNFQ
jgi:hypothetical protein